MQIKMNNFIKKYWLKVFSMSFFFLLLGAYANIFAVFTPGQTLDPNCAPGSDGCIVEIGGGSSSSPWLTGTSNIYHNGNVNVGSSTQPSLTSSIGVGDTIFSDVYKIENDSIVNADIETDNDGNIIVAYQDTSALYLLICQNTDCSDNDTVIVDEDMPTYSNASRYVYKPIIKVGSDNTIHIVYKSFSIKYATCTQEGVCNTTSIASTYGFYSFDLGPNNIPQIIYETSTGNPNYFKYLVLARYTGTGEETTCLNNDWKCSEISSDDEYSFGWTIQLDSMYIDQTDGFPRFVASKMPPFGDHTGEVFSVDYFKCTSLDCVTYEKESITNYTFTNNSEDGGLLPFSLSVDNNGDPVLLYTSTSYGGDLSIATYSGDGNGYGCLDNDWTCDDSIQDFNVVMDFKIDSNNNPRILSYESYVECEDIYCDNYTSASNYSLYAISLDSSDGLYLLSESDGGFSIKKKGISSGVTFDSSGNDFYTKGDGGISGNLFVDGSISTSSGLYIGNIGDGDATSLTNSLLNRGGSLYWNGSQLLTANDTVQNAYYAEHLSQTLGAYSGGTGLTSPGASGNVLTSNGYGWVSSLPSIKANSSTFLISSGLEGSGDLATYAYNSIFLGAYSGNSATNASSSNFLGYGSGDSATNASSSNFLGYMAGESSSFAFSSNFLGHMAGQGATNASNSNFLGPQSGYFATNAANSIFIGRQSGMNDTVNNTATYDDSTTFANTSILIGHKTGTGSFSNSIAIGAYATNTATNQFMIGSTTRPINTTVWKGTSVTATLDTATGLITTSDERLKTNIHILSNNTDYYSSGTTEDIDEEEISIDDMTTLEKVISIIPVRYDWREDSNDDYTYTDTTPKNIGFIAQDLQKYFPEVVYTGVDENHYLGVNYANMTPILVEAIKEMNLIVKDLSSLDTESATSLGSLIKNFLEDQAILINELTVNRLNISGDVCVDDICITKEQFKEMLINASSDDYVSGTPESE